MADFQLLQTQKTSQIQKQIMSQRQIFALKLISMQNDDLRKEIYKQIEENPALEIVQDKIEEGSPLKPVVRNSQVHTAHTNAKGQEESDNFQKILESTADIRETLQEHLLHQLNMIKTSDEEFELCKILIQNLDSEGHYILAPESLLKKQTKKKRKLLEKCIFIVRQFDPPGICCINFEESLKIQAELKNDATPLTKFILNGHLDFISPPDVEKSIMKIENFIKEQKKLAFQTDSNSLLIQKNDFTAEKMSQSIKYIQSLNPFPARNFGTDESAHFIAPDAVVTLEEGFIENENFDKGIVFDTPQTFFRVKIEESSIPKVNLSPNFTDFIDLTKKTAKKIDSSPNDSNTVIFEQLKNAKNFIDSLDFRHQVILHTTCNLVKLQKDFFRLGVGNLNPLTQREFAKILNVHESTVSRMADSKFIRCKWGTFPMKYFFSGAVKITSEKNTAPKDTSPQDKNQFVSTDKIKGEIAEILKAQKPGEKRLSDQKIADMLLEKGYNVARRTVAKYRTQMNIESSYSR